MIRIVGTGGSARRLRIACRGIDGDLIVVWGDATPTDVAGGVGIVNGMVKIGAIGQLQAFQTAEVPTIRWTQDIDQARRWARVAGYEVWGRDRTHTQGTDIVPNGAAGWDLKDLWVLKIPNVITEWRIHVWDEHTIGQGMKWRDGTPPEGIEGCVRSRHNGWTLRHDREVPKGIRPAAITAVKAVGYDFGAVDILWTQSGPVVLEVNSAPAVRDPYTLDRYVKAIEQSARRDQ